MPFAGSEAGSWEVLQRAGKVPGPNPNALDRAARALVQERPLCRGRGRHCLLQARPCLHEMSSAQPSAWPQLSGLSGKIGFAAGKWTAGRHKRLFGRHDHRWPADTAGAWDHAIVKGQGLPPGRHSSYLQLGFEQVIMLICGREMQVQHAYRPLTH